MTIIASSPQEYIEKLPEYRQQPFTKLYQTIKQAIDPQFAEQMSYTMVGWVVPFALHPAGYHVDPKLPLPFLAIGNQKHYIALYHLGVYADPELLHWFEQEYAKTGYKLDMGKSCIRFKKMDQIPFDLIGQLIGRMSLVDYVAVYQDQLSKK